MLQYFDTLTDVSGNALLGATVTVTNYPSGSAATIYLSNGTTQPIANNAVAADITGQVSFYLPDGAYTFTYAYKGATYKTRSPVQVLDPTGFVSQTDIGGGANAYAITTAALSAQKYVGLKIEMLAQHANTGASVLTYQGDAGFPINQPGGSALVGGMIQANGLTRLEWDGTQWQLIGAQAQPFYAANATWEAGVTVTNNAFYYGDLRRYGAKVDGATDDTAAINAAIKVAQQGLGYLYHPGGTCVHASQILAGNGFTVIGNDRIACVFKYTGSSANSAWRITNNGTTSPVVNTSGFGLVNFTGITITTAIAGSVAGGIEINACGYSYYNLWQMRITGTFKYGLILDGTEIVTVEKCILDNSGPPNAANIWLTNGPDRSPGQVAGFTNAIWIRSNQINIGGSGSNNIADDGGSDHYHSYNNLNGAQVPIRIAGVSGFELNSNEVENALGGSAAGEANFDFLTTTLSGTTVGGCDSGTISSNFLGADMAASSSTLNFAGNAAYKHFAISVSSNHFRNNGGRTADINVTNLANSRCENNYAEPGTPGQQHYTGVHNDVYGNTLLQPQSAPPWRASTTYAINAVVYNAPNYYICTTGGVSAASGGPTGTGSGIVDGTVTWNFTTQTSVIGYTQAARVFGDSRYVNQFLGGVDADSPNGLQIDEQQWNSFTVQIINNAGTLQVQIFDSGVGGAAAGYANKVINQSSTAINLPTVSNVAGFGSAPAGLVSGSTSVLVLNTAAQAAARNNCVGFIEQYTGNVAVYAVYCGIASRNINGSTIFRPEIRLTNLQSGASVNFDTTLLPAGKIINIKFSGYLL